MKAKCGGHCSEQRSEYFTMPSLPIDFLWLSRFVLFCGSRRRGPGTSRRRRSVPPNDSVESDLEMNYGHHAGGAEVNYVYEKFIAMLLCT